MVLGSFSHYSSANRALSGHLLPIPNSRLVKLGWIGDGHRASHRAAIPVDAKPRPAAGTSGFDRPPNSCDQRACVSDTLPEVLCMGEGQIKEAGPESKRLMCALKIWVDKAVEAREKELSNRYRMNFNMAFVNFTVSVSSSEMVVTP